MWAGKWYITRWIKIEKTERKCCLPLLRIRSGANLRHLSVQCIITKITWLPTLPSFRQHLSVLLYNFDSFCLILFKFTHHTLTIRECMFDRKIGAEGSVLQELCLFVILIIRCIISSPEPSGSQGELIVYPYSGVRRRRCRCRCRQQCLNIFSSETALPIKAKFYVEPPWEGGTKVYINGPGHMTKMAAMPIYGKNL